MSNAKQGLFKNVRAQIADDNHVDIFFIGEIDMWSYRWFAEWYANEWKEGMGARLHITSEGGSFFAGAAIYDFIRANKIKSEAYIYGLCGSAATIIAIATDKVYAGEMSQFFIHHVSGQDAGSVVMSNANEALNMMYQQKTGMSENEIEALLTKGDEGYIMKADEALSLGFIDEITKRETPQIAPLENSFGDIMQRLKNNYTNIEQTAKATTTTNMTPWEKIKNLFGFGGETDEVAAEKIQNLANSGLNVQAEMLKLKNEFDTKFEDLKNSLPSAPNLEGFAKAEDLTNLVKTDALTNLVTVETLTETVKNLQREIAEAKTLATVTNTAGNTEFHTPPATTPTAVDKWAV